MKRSILLTFDLEEFDLPKEYGILIPEEEQFRVTNEGLKRLTGILVKHNIASTFFTTASYAVKNSGIVKDLSLQHEIASHSFNHTGFNESDPIRSKIMLEGITGKPVSGFRMPRFAGVDRIRLKSDGYKYDSSVNPVYLPGRYNYLSSPRKVYGEKQSGLAEIPLSALPLLRIPLFWLTFKNIPVGIYLSFCRITLRNDKYLHLCFHPWEFADLRKYEIPGYIKSVSGERYAKRFEKLISGLSSEGEFSTVSGYLNSADCSLVSFQG